VAEGARLESVYTARYPGFESLSLRHTLVPRHPIQSRRHTKLSKRWVFVYIFRPDSVTSSAASELPCCYFVLIAMPTGAKTPETMYPVLPERDCPVGENSLMG
jgi:hypothetical protein